MNDSTKWIGRQLQTGRVLLVLGLILGLVGIALPKLVSNLPFDARIITGLGILLLGIGAAFLVRYSSAHKDPKVARRLAAEERDERSQMLRGRAGNRAYWVSAGMAYALLMWLSFSANGSLPELSQDALWWALAAVVVVPGVVYIASMVYDEKHI